MFNIQFDWECDPRTELCPCAQYNDCQYYVRNIEFTNNIKKGNDCEKQLNVVKFSLLSLMKIFLNRDKILWPK